VGLFKPKVLEIKLFYKMKKKKCLIVLVLSMLQNIMFAEIYKVEKYGAEANGKTDNAIAIQKAIDLCHQSGGGQVELSSGIYLSGTLELKSNVALHIAFGATLKAIPHIPAFKYIRSSVASRMDLNPWRAFIYADSQDNIRIYGGGTIDGSGDAPCFANAITDSPERPYGLLVINCTNVVVEDLNMRNSAFWMQRYFNCTSVRVNRLNVYNHANLNNDSIDIDSSNDVVVINNCVASSHASAIKLGTGSIGGFENIVISNIVIRRSKSQTMHHLHKAWGGLTGIDIASTDGGALRKILISNITMEDVLNPIHIRLGNRLDGEKPELKKIFEGNDTEFVLEDIAVSNVVARNVGPMPVVIAGFEGHPVKRVTLKDVTIHCGAAGTKKDMTTAPNWIATGYPGRAMYKTNLPAYGLISNFTEGLKVENFLALPAAGEPRPMEIHLNRKN
jgi:polygalacturonase